jgi:hypothetical protein
MLVPQALAYRVPHMIVHALKQILEGCVIFLLGLKP